MKGTCERLFDLKTRRCLNKFYQQSTLKTKTWGYNGETYFDPAPPVEGAITVISSIFSTSPIAASNKASNSSSDRLPDLYFRSSALISRSIKPVGVSPSHSTRAALSRRRLSARSATIAIRRCFSVSGIHSPERGRRLFSLNGCGL